MSLETCPYCGKPFKRLKSHLPHCKMSPASKTTQSSKSAKKAPLPNTPKDTTQTDSHKNVVNFFDKKLNDPSSQVKSTSWMKAEKVSMDESAMAKVTGKNKSKWLAKREQEMAKQAVLLTQMGSKMTADRQEKLNCLSETSQDHIKGAPETERKTAQGQKQATFKASPASPLTSLVTASNSSANVLEEVHASPKALSNLALAQRVTEQARFSLFQTKTSVWDHIKHGLYNRRSGVEPGLYSITQEVSVSKFGNMSASVHKNHSENQKLATKTSSPPSLALGQTTVQRPVDDMRTSTVQSKTALEKTPEMIPGYGGKLVSASHSGISSNEGSWTKCQSSRPSSQSRDAVMEQSLGDVRLGELAAWLGARTPNSPGEAVSMLNRGWQWYYGKYINVQKGGIGGIAMLLAGYCVLSYIWSYPHLRKERWRKYH